MSDGGPVSPGRGLLPAQLTRFVGRDHETEELLGLVQGERLLNLVGAPGCGKTRLALEVGARVGPGAGEVWFVELAPIGDPESVATAVGVALGIPEVPGQPMPEVLADALAGADPTLVLLDNCEHVIDAVAALAQHLVATCPSVRVLTTSRAALGVPGERVWSVPPLSLDAAVELFLDRARSVSRGSGFDDADGAVIEAICARLGCLPLAVELTAVWSRVLSPGQILDRLTGDARELAVPGRGRGPRHDTMAAAVEASHRLLPVDAQRLFEQLSVFAGSFDLDAIEAVTGAEDAGPGGDVLGWLTVLVDNSLVLTERVAGEPMRYRMLEPVRQYAEGLLATSADGDRVRRRHLDHYLDLADCYDPWRSGSRARPGGLGHLAQDEPNLLAAFEWARRQPGDLSLRLSAASGRYFAYAGRLNVGLRWLEDALTRGTQDRPLQARALAEAGMLAWRQGDYGLARTRLTEALTLARSHDDPLLPARPLIVLSAVEFSAGNLDLAEQHAHEAVDTYRTCGDQLVVARALLSLAWARYSKRDAPAGDELMRAALEANLSVGNISLIAYAHLGLQYGAALVGDVEAQRTHMAIALTSMNEGGIIDRSDWLSLGAVLAAGEGRFDAALQLLGGTDSFARRRGGTGPPEQLRLPFASLLDGVLEATSPTLAMRLLDRGRQMPWDDLVALALAEPETPAEQSPLTAREREIADLVAEGLTNVDIARKLVISRRTVETHVEHVKQKLGLANRNEIIAWAVREAPGSRDP